LVDGFSGGFLKEGWRRFGTAFPAMLCMLGFEAGRLAYQRHLEIAGGDAKAVVKVAEAFCQPLGYGKLEHPRSTMLGEKMPTEFTITSSASSLKARAR